MTHHRREDRYALMVGIGLAIGVILWLAHLAGWSW